IGEPLQTEDGMTSTGSQRPTVHLMLNVLFAHVADGQQLHLTLAKLSIFTIKARRSVCLQMSWK
ncbi:MAG: hypothetical protein DRP45_10265, partial [Candidatus Zixiibacteriota bacterium]